MSKRIFKYKLNVGINRIDLPENVDILSVAFDDDTKDIYMWAIVDEDAGTVKRRIDVIGTGWECEGDVSQFLGTVHWDEEKLVWHVFDFGVGT